jgi:DnaJ-class molecular chaperone
MYPLLRQEFFSYICNAYDILSDTQKRAIYDDELMNNNPGLFIIKIGKFNVNVVYVFM